MNGVLQDAWAHVAVYGSFYSKKAAVADKSAQW